MSTQSTERRIPHIPLQKASATRIALIITFVATLGLSSLLTTPPPSGASRGSSPTPVPTPRPTPSPTGPLPPVLSQALATLQTQNRLLYSGNASLPEIALTFDDGPNPYYTPQILAILQQYQVQATFFCIGRLVAAYPAIVRQVYKAGHIIGNHSWSHPDLALSPASYDQLQLTRTSDAIQTAIGVRPTFFRPPYGAMSVSLLTQAYQLSLTTVLWNDEGQDWSKPGAGVIIQRIFSFARNGAIILLHDGGGNRSQTVAALPFIIEGLEEIGFHFVTIQQMVTDLDHQRSATSSGATPTASPQTRPSTRDMEPLPN